MDKVTSDELLICSVSSSLVYRDGIWFSAISDSISYPKDGNNDCFALEDNSYWFRHRIDILTRIISEHINERRFFDIGGGNGLVTKALQGMGFDAWLVEPGLDGIVNAKSRGVKNLINATFESAHFKDGSLSNVGLFDVLEHIESDGELIDLICNALSPGGKVFITVPAFSFLWSDADTSAGHYRRYTLKSIRNDLEKTGFNILYSTYFFSFLVPLIFVFRVILDRVKKKKEKSKKDVHNISSGLIRGIIKGFCKFELHLIHRKRKILFGSSCLIVAQKA